MVRKRSLKRGLANGRAVIYFVIAYCLVTILATATTVTYGIIYHSPQPEGLGIGLLKAPSFVATVPYHVIIMLLVWPVFAWLYFKKRSPADQDTEVMETLRLAFFWLASAMIVDFVFFVLIKHPYSFTPHEFYVDYEPWISLIYISIFLSPFIRLGFSRLLANK
jgi:hypothetical protein